MVDVNPIDTNPVDQQGVVNQKASDSVGRFDAIQLAAMTAGVAGPVATTATGNDVVAAAVNAAAGGYYPVTPGAATGAGNVYFGGGGVRALDVSGVSSSTGGAAGSVGGSVGGAVGSGSATDTLAQAQSVLADSQASSVAMLMVQNEMGDQNRVYTTVSNLMNSRDNMESAIIRNVRVG